MTACPEPPLRVAVTELLARRSPSLSAFSPGGGLERLWIGSALHARYQHEARETDPGFRAEVSLRGELRTGGLRVEIRGRADGVREGPDGRLTVEELKTGRAGAPPPSAVREAYRDQVAIYAWLLARERDRPVAAELVWLDLAGEAPPRREPVELESGDVESRLRAALAPWLRDAQWERRERPRRVAAASRLRFPHAERRPGQDRIEEAVAGALAAGEHLLVEAPTGLGKSAAALAPALRFALETDRQVVFLTAKGTQRSGALRVHERLGAGDAAPGLALAAKRTLCANDVVVCHEDHCRFARDHHAKLARSDAVAQLLASAPALGPEAVSRFAIGLEACPHALSLEAARRAVLVVGDYNHALQPGAALAPFAPGGDPARVVLVLDEVHNVPDRARAIAGAALEARSLRAAAVHAGFGGAPVHREVEQALVALARWVEAEADEHCGAAPAAARAPIDVARFEERRAPLVTALGRRLAYALATGSLEAEDPVTECAFAVQRFARALEASDGATEDLAERREDGARLARVCVDSAPRLARIFSRCHAVIGLSATLSPLEHHRAALGLDPGRTGLLALPSPFPRENRCVVIDPGVGTRAGERGREAPRIARRIAALAAATPGHCLVLFPSFRLLEAVAARLPTPIPLLKQGPGAGAAERRSLVAALRAVADPPVLVLAVAGGILAEGVDYAGGGLAAVAVVGPCVPPPDPERELLRAAWEEREEDGFARAYALPGMTRVVQAAGRLLRSPEDRGVIALLGRRFLEAPYRDALPEDWCGGEPERCVGDAAEAARRFFA